MVLDRERRCWAYKQVLVALDNGTRVEAADAERGPLFRCPKCNGVVTLKKGDIVIHHFAHKPPTDCAWAAGETLRHLLAKRMLRDGLRAQGLQADLEVEVLSRGGDRRADVAATLKDGRTRVAFEIQHQPILWDEIERRTFAYMAAHVPVAWVGLISDETLGAAEEFQSGLYIERYPARPWERWAHTYAFGQIWYLDQQGAFWKGKFSEHRLDVPLSSWYGEGGEEQYAGGYTRTSRRWKELRLSGPYAIESVSVQVEFGKPWRGKDYSVPGGKRVMLFPP